MGCPREIHARSYSSDKRNNPAGKPRAFATGWLRKLVHLPGKLAGVEVKQ